MNARNLLLAVLAILTLVVLGSAAALSSWRQVPPAPQPAQYFAPQASGRPGVFRFHPYQEIQSQRAEVKELHAGIERAQALLPSVSDAAARQELKSELARWQAHLDWEEQHLRTSAGPTAAEVETRLNEMKGSRTCGVCHGTENIGRNIPVGDLSQN